MVGSAGEHSRVHHLLVSTVEFTTYSTLWLTHTVDETKMTPPVQWLIEVGVRVRLVTFVAYTVVTLNHCVE